jgi:hypothetical protein
MKERSILGENGFVPFRKACIVCGAKNRPSDYKPSVSDRTNSIDAPAKIIVEEKVISIYMNIGSSDTLATKQLAKLF